MKKQQAKQNKNRSLLLVAGIILVVAAIALAVALRPAPAAPQTAAAAQLAPLPVEVSVKEAASLRDQGAFVLDVREPDEWDAGHIPGATLIPLGELPNRLSDVPADQNVVVVCRSGNRSAQATDLLRQAGLSHTTSMAGGMNEWAAAGYEVVTGP
jgi:rhodanese-related sulfurtransferase